MKSKNFILCLHIYITTYNYYYFCSIRIAERNIQLEEIATKHDNLERTVIDLTNVSLNNTCIHIN